MHTSKKNLLKFSLVRGLCLIVLLASLQGCDELGEVACSFFTGDCSDSPNDALLATKAFEARDAEYSAALDEVIATTLPAPAPAEERVDGPFRLVAIDPNSGAERRLDLPYPGRYVSVGPSGMDAAVLHPVSDDVNTFSSKGTDGVAVSYIDLIDMEILDTHDVPGFNAGDIRDIVLDGNGIAHIFSSSSSISVDLMTGSTSAGESGLSNPTAKLADSGDSLIVVEGGTLQRFDISMGAIAHDSDSPSGRDLGACTPDISEGPRPEDLLSLSSDLSLIVTPCGDVFQASDLAYLRTIEPTPLVFRASEDRNLRYMTAYDDEHPFVGLAFTVIAGLATQPLVGFFNLDSGALENVWFTPRPSDGTNGQFVFYNSDGTRVVIVARVNATVFPSPTRFHTLIASAPVPN